MTSPISVSISWKRRSVRLPSLKIILQHLKTLLQAGQDRYEVMVLDKDWETYLQENQLFERPEHGSNAGAREKEKWRDLAGLIAAYMLVEHKVEVSTRLDATAAGKAIFEEASKDGDVSKLPKDTTNKRHHSVRVREHGEIQKENEFRELINFTRRASTRMENSLAKRRHSMRRTSQKIHSISLSKITVTKGDRAIDKEKINQLPSR